MTERRNRPTAKTRKTTTATCLAPLVACGKAACVSGAGEMGRKARGGGDQFRSDTPLLAA